jgi:hypothetical protein
VKASTALQRSFRHFAICLSCVCVLRKKQLEFRDSLLSLPSRLRRRVHANRHSAATVESPDADLASFDRLLDRMTDMCEGRRRMLPDILSLPPVEPVTSHLFTASAQSSARDVRVVAGGSTETEAVPASTAHHFGFSTITAPVLPPDDGRGALRGCMIVLISPRMTLCCLMLCVVRLPADRSFKNDVASIIIITGRVCHCCSIWHIIRVCYCSCKCTHVRTAVRVSVAGSTV